MLKLGFAGDKTRQLSRSMQSWFQFDLDGESLRVEKEATHLSLAEFLARLDPVFAYFTHGKPWRGGSPVILGDLESDIPRFRLVDAGLMLMPMLAGRQVWTPVGIKNADPDHPVNVALSRGHFESGSERNGTITALMFEGFYRPDLRRQGQMNDQFDCLLTRTMNVPVIRKSAAEVFASVEQIRHDAAQKAQRSGQQKQVWTGRRDIHEDCFSRKLFRMKAIPELSYVDDSKRRFYRPKTLIDLLRLRREYPNAQLIAGGTELAQKSSQVEWPNLISLEGVEELTHITTAKDYWEIGAAASLTRTSEVIGRECPPFNKILRRFGSRAIRNRATIGGNLATAWSAGQITPLLIALDARVMLLSDDGERDAPVSQFFEEDGKPILRPGEIIRSIIIPRSTESLLESRGMTSRICNVYTVSGRRNLAEPFITGAFAVELREKLVAKAWIAFSGISPAPFRIREVEETLAGKLWNEDNMFETLSLLHKATAKLPELQPGKNQNREDQEYREQLVTTLFQKFFYQHPDAESVKPEKLTATGEFARLDHPFFDAIPGPSTVS